VSTLNVNNINEAGGVDAVITAGDIEADAITAVNASALPAGSILQVVKFETGTSTTTTSSSYIDSALASSITPSSASSKVLILASIGQFGNNNTAGAALARLYRGDTATGVALGLQQMIEAYNNNGSGLTVNEASIIYLDEPATTSSVTYTVGLLSQSSSNTSYMRRQQTMLLLEVAA